MSNNEICFITGSCGAGKTSVLELLKSKLSKELYDFHDLDERGFKPIEGWIEGELQYFKEQAENKLKEGITTFISGFSRPAEILDPLQDNNHLKIILLHASPEVIRARIMGRYPSEESKDIFLKKHNKTVEKFADDNANYVLKLKKDFELYPIYTINTDNIGLEEVAQKIIELIK